MAYLLACFARFDYHTEICNVFVEFLSGKGDIFSIWIAIPVFFYQIFSCNFLYNVCERIDFATNQTESLYHVKQHVIMPLQMFDKNLVWIYRILW